jgi:hypothetical protein
MKIILAWIVSSCMVMGMEHTTNIQADIKFLVHHQDGKMVISIFKDKDEQEITLNYWEAVLIHKKLGDEI